MAAGMIAGLGLVNSVAQDVRESSAENRRDTCLTAIEQNAKLLNVTKPFAASPRSADYFEYLVKQFHFPPKICKGTGIDTERELAKFQRGLPTFTIPTTTTTTAPPGAQGPPGPQGKQGPPGRSGGPSATTTTTSPRPTTTTTAPPSCTTLPVTKRCL